MLAWCFSVGTAGAIRNIVPGVEWSSTVQYSAVQFSVHFKACLKRIRLLSRDVKVKICKTIILPVALYVCETLSLILREENRLRVFENRVLRRIF
jgi:hypothetical protein